MSSFRYEISENNEISIWPTDAEEESLPIFFQPDWPDGTPWQSKSEAESWALAMVASMENEDTEHVPGPGPDSPLIPRPPKILVEEEVLESQATEENIS